MEVYSEYTSHEWLDTDPGNANYQSCTSTQWGYGWNAQVVSAQLVLEASNITSIGADLNWSQYPGSDFNNYIVCRSTTSPVSSLDDITTIAAVSTITFTDTTANPGTQYYYAVYVEKDNLTTIKSNEVIITTASVVGGRSLLDGFESFLLRGRLVRCN
jgi:hypothetical protein